MNNLASKNKHVRSRAPLRIGLAGGGTDISDFYHQFKGAVLNATIKKYAFSDISHNNNGLIACASDLGTQININNPSELSFNEVKELPLHWNVYKYMMDKYNEKKYISAKLNTYCDSPVGSGLGSSSALVVSMVKCWDEFLNLGLDEYKIATDAIYVERTLSKFSGGHQDHYSASFGGINFIEFEKNNTVVESLDIKRWFKYELESSIILHFCGVSRFSSEIIKDQIEILNSNSDKVELLFKLKENAYKMKNALLKNSISDINKLLNEAWKIKLETSKKIQTKLIRERIQFGIENGAVSAKVSGAGGGGFILFITRPENAIYLRNKLIKFNQNTFTISLSEESAEAWVIDE